MLVGWPQARLAATARVSLARLVLAEATDSPLALTEEEAIALERALTSAGVVFLRTEGPKPTIRLKVGRR